MEKNNEDPGKITLDIDGTLFTAKKATLCENSDYFKAMFCGSYVENDKKEITIDVVGARSMEIILAYMDNGLIDLSALSLPTLSELAAGANFLQVTDLLKQIELYLCPRVTINNWVDILEIAENCSYSKLERIASGTGLTSFRKMKASGIPNITKLFWYLSHPYLDTSTELDVFKFGYEWLLQNELGHDGLLLILASLDMKKLEKDELKEIQQIIGDCTDSLAEKVIQCLYELRSNCNELSRNIVIRKKEDLCQVYTERVYKEVLNLLTECPTRLLKYTAAVPIWLVEDKDYPPKESAPHHLYTYDEDNGFNQWTEVADKSLWGFSICGWGPLRIVVACGEHGRGTGVFKKGVCVYHLLRDKWVWKNIDLPSRRHTGIAVVDDSLFIVGGVGGFRIVLDTTIICNLNTKSVRKGVMLPDAIQTPALCTHNNKVYAAGHKNIYRYDIGEDTERWSIVLSADFRNSCLISFKDYIYCTQNYFNHLYRFKPDVNDELEMITMFTNPPATICNLGERLLAFTRSTCGESTAHAVEEYVIGNDFENRPRVLHSESESQIKVNDVAGSVSVVIAIPLVKKVVCQYHKQYLTRFSENF